MKTRCIFTALFLVIALALSNVSTALAFPSLPASFYGTVKVNGANVPDGTLVQALINGKMIIETQTQTYQGNSFYSLDVPADDPDTTDVEGGQNDDTIKFVIGGIVADESGTWKSGTIVNLDLSASSAATLIPAQATYKPTPIPTQTVIIVVGETPIPLTTKTQSAPTNPVLTQDSARSTALVLPTPTISAGTNSQNNPAVSSTTNLDIGFVIAGILLFIILLTSLWLILSRKPKVK